MENLEKSRHNYRHQIRLLQSLVWPVAVYGYESWTTKRSDENRLEAFEMKALTQILRVSRTGKKTNSWVLEQAGVDRSLLANVKSRKLRYFGHIMRGEDKSHEKGIIEGTLPPGIEKEEDNVTSWTYGTEA